MNFALLLFVGVLAFLLAHSNHPALGMLIGGLAIAWMVVAPFLENSISSFHYPRRRPGPPTRRPPKR